MNESTEEVKTLRDAITFKSPTSEYMSFWGSISDLIRNNAQIVFRNTNPVSWSD